MFAALLTYFFASLCRYVGPRFYCGVQLATLAFLTMASPARADCPAPMLADPGGDIRAADIIADTVVLRVRPRRGSAVEQIVTVRVAKAWKGVEAKARLDVVCGGDEDCDGAPSVGVVEERTQLKRYSGQLYFLGECARSFAPGVLEAYVAERERLRADARERPADLEAALALGAHYVYWDEAALALPILRRLGRANPDNPRVHYVFAEVLADVGQFDDANRAASVVYKSMETRKKYGLLEAKISAMREQAQTKSKLSLATARIAINTPPAIAGENLARTRLTNIEFRSPLLAHGSDWSGSRLFNVGLHGADFSSARLDDAYGDNTSLDGANLSEAQAANFTCRACRFAGADLHGFAAAGAAFLGSRFERALLSQADLSGADMRRTNFTGADISGARLDDANLEAAVLTGVVANGASMRNARLYRSDLRGADLSDADLSGANLALEQVDCDTRLPANFEKSKTQLISTASCPGQAPL